MIRPVVLRAATVALVSGGLLAPGGASAVVNCKFVMKNLSLPGRTVEEVAENMGITEQEVIKCQEEAQAQKAAEGAKAAEGQQGQGGE
jgi:hypothetical protein